VVGDTSMDVAESLGDPRIFPMNDRILLMRELGTELVADLKLDERDNVLGAE